MRRVFLFFALLAGTVASLLLLRYVDVRFDARQLASITIFTTFIYGTLLFGEMRLGFAFGGIALLLALNLLTVDGFTESANLRVIIFLVGMFLVIGYLEENQFFEHIVSGLVRAVGPHPRMLLLAMMLMATVSAALVDEVTSILFMTGTMLHLTSKYRLRPIPFVIMLVFATNIGSSASSIGNPIGVMIAFDAGFSFTDFLRWSAPVAIGVNLLTYGICRWWFSADIAAFTQAVEAEQMAKQRRVARRELVPAGIGGGSDDFASEESPQDWSNPHGQNARATEDDATGDEADEPVDVRQQLICWLVFGGTILLLVTHGVTERLLGRLVNAPGGTLPEGTMMMGAALTMGALVLLLRKEQARQLLERRVDWWTLSFFMMLFASVGTLEHTHVTRVIADKMIAATAGNNFALVQLVGWSTGWLSAFLDNVLAVATFMPVVHDVRVAAAPAPYSASIYWMMLFGGTFMGNMTVIGSTANIIAVGLLEKRGHGTVRFGEWFKIGFIVSVASMILASILLQLQSPWIPVMPPPK
jgi:Na+/H+ antiporter NhaD/arsenite permease-like protein